MFLVGGQLAFFGLLAGRMYQLQVLEANRYKTLAEENRINIRLLSPQRGRILDRFGIDFCFPLSLLSGGMGVSIVCFLACTFRLN